MSSGSEHVLGWKEASQREMVGLQCQCQLTSSLRMLAAGRRPNTSTPLPCDERQLSGSVGVQACWCNTRLGHVLPGVETGFHEQQAGGGVRMGRSWLCHGATSLPVERGKCPEGVHARQLCERGSCRRWARGRGCGRSFGEIGGKVGSDWDWDWDGWGWDGIS